MKPDREPDDWDRALFRELCLASRPIPGWRVLSEPELHRRMTAPDRVTGREYLCGCGYEFPEELGAYGCPNCEGDDGPAQLQDIPEGAAHGQ